MIELVSIIIKSKKVFAMYLKIFTTTQQNTLKVLAARGGVGLFDKRVLIGYDIETLSLQSAIKSLMEKGVLFKLCLKFL